MNKKGKIITLGIFVIALIATLVLTTKLVEAPSSGTTTVALTIGNSIPIINWTAIDDSTVDLTQGSTKKIEINFTATDSNGATDLNDTTSSAKISTTEFSAQNTSCARTVSSGITREYTCEIYLPYYYNASASWAINASIEDNQNTTGANDTEVFTINTLEYMVMTPTAVNFGTGLTAGTNDVAATDDPIVLNNTGNTPYGELNVTGYDLVGQTTPTEIIPAGSFAVNVLDAATGNAMINNTAVVITNFDLPKFDGATGVQSDDTYYYVDLPILSAQQYSTTGSTVWTLEVFNI